MVSDRDSQKDFDELCELLNYKDQFGRNPIGIASQRGYLGLVKFLLESGARLDTELKSPELNLEIPIITAARCGHLELVKFFMDRDKYKQKVIQEMLTVSPDYKTSSGIKNLLGMTGESRRTVDSRKTNGSERSVSPIILPPELKRKKSFSCCGGSNISSSKIVPIKILGT
jgi:ankyrin repeat protein